MEFENLDKLFKLKDNIENVLEEIKSKTDSNILFELEEVLSSFYNLKIEIDKILKDNITDEYSNFLSNKELMDDLYYLIENYKPYYLKNNKSEEKILIQFEKTAETKTISSIFIDNKQYSICHLKTEQLCYVFVNENGSNETLKIHCRWGIHGFLASFDSLNYYTLDFKSNHLT